MGAEDAYPRFHEPTHSIMWSHKRVVGVANANYVTRNLSQWLDFWADPYTHANQTQLNAATWYVHDNGHRAPTYSGIDITCGSENPDVHGGLLIRELDGEHRWVFQRIVRGNSHPLKRKGNIWTPEEAKIVTGSIYTRAIDAEIGLLRLVPCELIEIPLYSGPRISLNLETAIHLLNDFALNQLGLQQGRPITSKQR